MKHLSTFFLACMMALNFGCRQKAEILDLRTKDSVGEAKQTESLPGDGSARLDLNAAVPNPTFPESGDGSGVVDFKVYESEKKVQTSRPKAGRSSKKTATAIARAQSSGQSISNSTPVTQATQDSFRVDNMYFGRARFEIWVSSLEVLNQTANGIRLRYNAEYSAPETFSPGPIWQTHFVQISTGSVSGCGGQSFLPIRFTNNSTGKASFEVELRNLQEATNYNISICIELEFDGNAAASYERVWDSSVRQVSTLSLKPTRPVVSLKTGDDRATLFASSENLGSSASYFWNISNTSNSGSCQGGISTSVGYYDVFNLSPDSLYYYSVCVESRGRTSDITSGSFRTKPIIAAVSIPPGSHRYHDTGRAGVEGSWVTDRTDPAGFMTEGPFVRLGGGIYRASFDLSFSDISPDANPNTRLARILAGSSSSGYDSREITLQDVVPGQPMTYQLQVSSFEVNPNIEFAVYHYGTAAIEHIDSRYSTWLAPEVPRVIGWGNFTSEFRAPSPEWAAIAGSFDYSSNGLSSKSRNRSTIKRLYRTATDVEAIAQYSFVGGRTAAIGIELRRGSDGQSGYQAWIEQLSDGSIVADLLLKRLGSQAESVSGRGKISLGDQLSHRTGVFGLKIEGNKLQLLSNSSIVLEVINSVLASEGEITFNIEQNESQSAYLHQVQAINLASGGTSSLREPIGLNMPSRTVNQIALKWSHLSSNNEFLVAHSKGYQAPATCAGGNRVSGTAHTIGQLERDTPYSIRVCHVIGDRVSAGVVALAYTLDSQSNGWDYDVSSLQGLPQGWTNLQGPITAYDGGIGGGSAGPNFMRSDSWYEKNVMIEVDFDFNNRRSAAINLLARHEGSLARNFIQATLTRRDNGQLDVDMWTENYLVGWKRITGNSITIVSRDPARKSGTLQFEINEALVRLSVDGVEQIRGNIYNIQSPGGVAIRFDNYVEDKGATVKAIRIKKLARKTVGLCVVGSSRFYQSQLEKSTITPDWKKVVGDLYFAKGGLAARRPGEAIAYYNPLSSIASAAADINFSGTDANTVAMLSAYDGITNHSFVQAEITKRENGWVDLSLYSAMPQWKQLQDRIIALYRGGERLNMMMLRNGNQYSVAFNGSLLLPFTDVPEAADRPGHGVRFVNYTSKRSALIEGYQVMDCSP